jgi:hypothetical protein
MSLLPTPNTSSARQRLRKSARWAWRWLWNHRELVSWLVWALGVLLCVAWAQRYYHPPAPAWLGKTIRVTVVAIVLAFLREWLALRWEDGHRVPQPHHGSDEKHDDGV